MNDQVPVEDDEASRIREPSLLDALIPVVTLSASSALTIALFGTDATGGPLQVALLTSALVAGIVALKNGHIVARVREAVDRRHLARPSARCSSSWRSARSSAHGTWPARSRPSSTTASAC